MNIGDLLTKAARIFPDHLALAYGPRRWTYAQFDARVNRLARALRRLGLESGARVAMLMYNRPEMLESIFACFKAGLCAIPLNFRLHPSELAYIIDHAQARAIVTASPFDETIATIRDQLPQVSHYIAIEPLHSDV